MLQNNESVWVKRTRQYLISKNIGQFLMKCRQINSWRTIKIKYSRTHLSHIHVIGIYVYVLHTTYLQTEDSANYTVRPRIMDSIESLPTK